MDVNRWDSDLLKQPTEHPTLRCMKTWDRFHKSSQSTQRAPNLALTLLASNLSLRVIPEVSESNTFSS